MFSYWQKQKCQQMDQRGSRQFFYRSISPRFYQLLHQLSSLIFFVALFLASLIAPSTLSFILPYCFCNICFSVALRFEKLPSLLQLFSLGDCLRILAPSRARARAHSYWHLQRKGAILIKPRFVYGKRQRERERKSRRGSIDTPI